MMINKLQIFLMFLGVLLILLGDSGIIYGIYGIICLRNLSFIFLQIFSFVLGLIGSLIIFCLIEND